MALTGLVAGCTTTKSVDPGKPDCAKCSPAKNGCAAKGNCSTKGGCSCQIPSKKSN
jgi:hypothetical protein